MELEEISQKQILPKDIFRNRSSWFCYELYKFFRSSEILTLCLILIWALYSQSSIYKNIVLDALCTPLFWLLIGVNIPLRLEYSKWNPKGEKKLAQQVWQLNPGTDMAKWNTVSCKLNILFYQEHLWETPYFFFDGQHARGVFIRNVLNPFFKGKLEDPKKVDERRASTTYLQSINEDFELSLKNNLPELAPKSEPQHHARKKGFFYKIFVDGFGLVFDLFTGYLFLYPLGYCVLYFVIRDPRRAFSQLSLGAFLKLIYAVCMTLWDFWLLFVDRLSQESQAPLFEYALHALNLYVTFRLLLYSDQGMMNTAQAIKFLALIAKHEPRKNLEGWNKVAISMNEDTNGYKFVDGKDCLRFYKKYFESLSHGKSSLEYGDLREIVSRTQQYVD